MNEISSIEKIQLIHQTLNYLITEDKPDKIDSYLIGLASLHNLIGKIEAEKWNTHAFLNDPEWVFIRETAQTIKKLMTNGKF